MDALSWKQQQELVKKERDRFHAQVAADDDDALAPYERYVAWLTEQRHTCPEGPFDLELLTVLEEAVRSRKDDPDYKNDVRYVKLWLTYARRVEKPDIVYVFLLKNEIGVKNAQLYEDYAGSLESQDRFREAEQAYRLGISRSKRGADRLKARYKEFKHRVESNTTLKKTQKPPYIPPGESSSLAAKLYRNPLRNVANKRTQGVASAPNGGGTSSTPSPSKAESAGRVSSDRYAHMKAALEAPVAPGKKAEKYCFDISLLFNDNKEFSIEEARAACLGLLGKKWGLPPMSESGFHRPASVKQPTVSLKDGSNSRPPTKSIHLRTNMNMTAGLSDQPTVTLNTKEALKDVLGMYNSPDRTMKTTNIAVGSKHAPVKNLEPVLSSQPRNNLKKITELDDEESEEAPPKVASFRPFVDDENKKENAPPAPAKFKPFVDEDLENKTPHVTPKPRKALAPKEIHAVTPVSRQKDQEGSEAQPEAELEAPQGSRSRNAFGRVFTPVGKGEKARHVLQPKVLEERPAGDKDSQRHNGTQGNAQFGSTVFSRPDSRPLSQIHEATTSSSQGLAFRRTASTPQHLTFTPNARDRPHSTFTPKRTPKAGEPIEPSPEPEAELESEVQPELEESPAEEIEEYGDDFESESPVDSEVAEEAEYYEEEDFRNLPMGGRLGHVDVMTPIAERTFECTMTTRSMLWTPSGENGPIPDPATLNHGRDAALAAEKLARELEEQEAKAKDTDEEMENAADGESEESNLAEERIEDEDEELIERTGTLSLADALAVASSFKPPNPCNPSDPHIVNTLLSLIPSEPDFYDLRTEISSRLDGLQKFAMKIGRRGSGNSSSRTSGIGETFQVELPNRAFRVSDKLGEGGFGAVFQAKAVRAGAQSDDEDMDSEDEDEDDEDADMFALKVVKPRNLWEYHILRRIHSVLPVPRRQSIITPHALYAYRDESFLVLDLCNQGTLLDVVNHAAEAGVVQQGACLDELLVIFFSIELIKFVESMHSIGFIHGDLKIDNCLLRLEEVPGGSNAWSGMYQPTGEGGWKYKGIKMIDFGRTIDTRMYPAGQQFIADWKTDVYDCPEMRENRPWTYQTDYFGLAGIIYCMLFGKYFESGTVTPIPSTEPVRYKLSSPFKRYWQSDLWTRLFDLLLNPTLARQDKSLPLVLELASLREEMETWLSSNCNRSTNTLKGLLKKIERSVLSSSG